MPRLYREAPLQSIWEGSGNVAALDALRALTRQPETAEAFFAELDQARGADHRLDDAVDRLRKDAADPSEHAARRLAESLAVTLQASLLDPARPPGGRRRLHRHPAGRRGRPRLRHPPRGHPHRRHHPAGHPGDLAASYQLNNGRRGALQEDG